MEARKRLPRLMAALATILGLALSLFQLWPRLAVSQLPTLNPDRPIEVPFQFTNSGSLAMRGVEWSCEFNQMKMGTGITLDRVGFRGSTLPDPIVHAGESFTAMCSKQMDPVAVFSDGTPGGPRITNADITVAVNYRPWILPFTTTERFRFVTEAASDGTLRWNPIPLTSPNR